MKNLPANVRDAGPIPGLGRSPGVGNGNPSQYSCLENPMDKEATHTHTHVYKDHILYDSFYSKCQRQIHKDRNEVSGY